PVSGVACPPYGGYFHLPVETGSIEIGRINYDDASANDAPSFIIPKKPLNSITLISKLSSFLRLAVILVLGPTLQFASVRAAETTRAASPEQPGKPHRLVVLTDIEADPDDTQSLVRLLLYSNEVNIQGLIATTSIHKQTSVAPESIRNVIHAYAIVHDNLLKHDANYPTAESLLALVKQGLPEYGMKGVGDDKDSEGSDWVIKILELDGDRPLWVSVWGGANTLAQALHKIKATRSNQQTKHLLAKLRVYTISDQDDSGIWIRKNFPELFYIVSPGGYGAGTWTGINHVVSGFDDSTISNRWIAENIQQGHGPLGSVYPDVAWGVEGDTPSWLSLIPNGLNAPEHPDWGGWGGRYEFYIPQLSAIDPNGFTGGVPVEPESRAIWTNAIDEYTPSVAPEYGRATKAGKKSFKDFRTTVWRWREDFQNDFAARMHWTTKPYNKANHPPSPSLEHPDRITVRSGETFGLGARGTTDPDGDSLSFYWFQYSEAGTCKAPLTFGAENAIGVAVTAPKVKQTETAHIILRVTDKGSPPLSRYKRVIVTIIP
ncbi:MAG: DUF1593 domain-containing protein, partial [Sedimentisphaerales bacterium]|nr:DUF1593 domain-containing protein [Sedimentisphaerales bacterium]